LLTDTQSIPGRLLVILIEAHFLTLYQTAFCWWETSAEYLSVWLKTGLSNLMISLYRGPR